MTINPPGKLSIVATPIGNRDDISLRAIKTLQSADLILAEDTRHSKRLLDYHCINTRLKACHEHNEGQLLSSVIEDLLKGLNIALISDAGTPLISDPGFVLVRAVRDAGLDVVAIPGPSSIIAALSVAGLPTDRFYFEGFLPAKTAARKEKYQELMAQSCTVVVLESAHRIKSSLSDLATVMGEERVIAVARELTKKFETVLYGSAAEVLEQVRSDADQVKGEFVVLISGTPRQEQMGGIDPHRLMQLLCAEVSLKTAAKLAAQITGQRKNELYEIGLALK